MPAAELRSAFPLLARFAYLNAGTCGPIPTAAAAAARDVLDEALTAGRFKAHFERMTTLHDAQRAAYAKLVGAGAAGDVALTTSASEGMVRVLTGLRLRAGDEIVTSDEEHPGLLGPLAAARERLGVEVRVVPFAELANAVGPRTALVACSHVSWLSGELAPAGLADVGAPVLLDGAQGAGAVPIDVGALGCAFYAAAGQKWLCGPIGTGLLYVAPEWQEHVRPAGPTYVNLTEPGRGLDSAPHADARALDAPALPAEASAFALAAHDVLAGFGWDAVYERAATLAEHLAQALTERGRDVRRRSRTTLVSWEDDGPTGTRDALAAAGIIVRDLPGGRLVRASVGAWNDERDIDRLLDTLDRRGGGAAAL